MSEKPTAPEPGATPGLLIISGSGVVLGVVLIAAFCLMGNAWLIPVVLLAIVLMALLLAAAVVHLIDTGTVVPSVAGSRQPPPAPARAPKPAPRPVLHH
jgi:hypothetical protein